MKVQILASPPDMAGKRQPVGLKILSLPTTGQRQLLPMEAIAKHGPYVEVGKEAITYHTVDGDVVFHIVHEPGRFCLTCGERLPDHGGSGTALEVLRAQECRDHVEEHGNKAVKTSDWPHGYVNRPSTFECAVEDKRNG